MTLRRVVAALACLVASLCNAAEPSGTMPYPNRSIRIIVPFAAGSGGDYLGRLLAAKFVDVLGQPAIVENRPGAAGNLAMEIAARAAPDGYTLVLGNAGTNTVNPSIYRSPGFDPVHSFVPISKLTTVPSVIVAGPASPVRTLGEMVALARREPGKLDYATTGIGLTSHLAMATLAARAGVELVHIPYASSSLLKGVLAGEVPLACSAIEVVRESVKAGRLHALAVTGSHRVDSLPGTPTVAESGFPGFAVVSWYGLLAPSGTPPDIVDHLHAALVRILRYPEVAAAIASAGQEVVGNTPEQFALEIRADLVRGRALVEALKIRVD